MAALHRICFLILSPRQHKDTFESAPPNVIKNEVGKNKKRGGEEQPRGTSNG